MHRALSAKDNPEQLKKVKIEVEALTKRFPIY